MIRCVDSSLAKQQRNQGNEDVNMCGTEMVVLGFSLGKKGSRAWRGLSSLGEFGRAKGLEVVYKVSGRCKYFW